MTSSITPIPAFADNYFWLLHADGGSSAAVVDPGDAEPVLEALKRVGLPLGAILITHCHGDHVGGVMELAAVFPGIPVYGPAHERIPLRTQALADGDRVFVPGSAEPLRVIDVPGHTPGHIAYFGGGSLFCGDTLFAGGCGRVFGGTLVDLHASLGRLKALPGDTKVYCAHEYTLDNLGFAAWVEPDNPRLQQRQRVEQAKRARGEPTVPSLLSEEQATNPFLRTDQLAVRRAAERHAGRPLGSEAEVFATIRTWKDNEYD